DGNWNIYTVRLDGTGLGKITKDNSNDVDPVWSPDGDRIAFSSDREGGYTIFTTAVDGTDVVETGQAGYPSDWTTEG
ncbi:MAG: hypothetical protein V1249_14350, partial [Acidimicrobiales bacterium]|nr:hypothetical protein [Acidimicrobiales bacterium]